GLGTFVSSSGSDTNPGTQALPLRTIAKGIDQAASIGNGVDVYVAAGTYAESVAVVEGVSLYGGWAESPTGWAHDVAANPATLACPTFRCVEVPSTVTRDTTIDGFTIEGLAGQPSLVPGSVAVAIEGGSPILSHDKIHGGAVSGAPDSTMQLSVAVE